METAAANAGQIAQVRTIFVKAVVSVSDLEKKFQPMIAPTIAWEVDTGYPIRVIKYTLAAAAKATMNAPAMAFTEPSFPNVCDAPAPLITAPSMINKLQNMAAVRKRIILVPTAVPKTLDASFAPSDHPRNSPLVRKNPNIPIAYNDRLIA